MRSYSKALILVVLVLMGSMSYAAQPKVTSHRQLQNVFLKSQIETTQRILDNKIFEKNQIDKQLKELQSNLGLIESFTDHESRSQLRKKQSQYQEELSQTEGEINYIKQQLLQLKQQTRTSSQ